MLIRICNRCDTRFQKNVRAPMYIKYETYTVRLEVVPSAMDIDLCNDCLIRVAEQGEQVPAPT